jgi:hypothetical protein
MHISNGATATGIDELFYPYTFTPKTQSPSRTLKVQGTNYMHASRRRTAFCAWQKIEFMLRSMPIRCKLQMQHVAKVTFLSMTASVGVQT